MKISEKSPEIKYIHCSAYKIVTFDDLNILMKNLIYLKHPLYLTNIFFEYKNCIIKVSL